MRSLPDQHPEPVTKAALSSGSGRALPVGLSIAMPADSIESVATKAGTLDLLATGHGVEVIRGSLKHGERLNFVPTEPGAPSAHEVCLLIDGILVAPDALGGQRLSVGSLITSEGLLEPVSFTADGDVRFVYITSAPMFHHISHDMNELRRLAVDIEVTDGYTADH